MVNSRKRRAMEAQLHNERLAIVARLRKRAEAELEAKRFEEGNRGTI